MTDTNSDTPLSGKELEHRILVTRTVMSILDSWNLGTEQCLQILQLPGKTALRSLRKYRNDTPFPPGQELDKRIEHLIGIAEALRTTYPRNAHMAERWMNRPNRRFNRRSPVSVILEYGMGGLINVRTHLDCAFAWECSTAS